MSKEYVRHTLIMLPNPIASVKFRSAAKCSPHVAHSCCMSEDRLKCRREQDVKLPRPLHDAKLLRPRCDVKLHLYWAGS